MKLSNKYGRKFALPGLAALAMLAVSSVCAYAQDSSQEPKPAGHGMPPLEDQSQQNTPPATQPDDRPLTGIQQTTAGSPEMPHSYWVPGFQITQLFESNPPGNATANLWTSVTYLAGNLSLLNATPHSTLSLNYTGGGSISNASSSAHLNGSFQELAASDLFRWNRWKFTLLDQFSYLPTTSFGFGGVTGIGAPGVSGSLGGPQVGISGGGAAGQTIFSGFGPQYSNSAGAQTEYLLTHRSSINFGGVYTLLRFTESGNVESNTYTFNGGYNYQMTKFDTLGVLYRFTAFRFIGNPQEFNDHVAQVAYGRKITGRLALQLSAGPEYSTFLIPVGTRTSQLTWSTNAGLDYLFERGDIGLSYAHGLNGGSGILVGSQADTITAHGSRQLGRNWSGLASFGYARNRSLTNSTVITTSQNYNSYYITAGLGRQIGRDAKLTLGYTAQIQNSNLAFCTTVNCSTTYSQNQVSIGFQWHTRPFVLH
jgi:hypothetical protein